MANRGGDLWGGPGLGSLGKVRLLVMGRPRPAVPALPGVAVAPKGRRELWRPWRLLALTLLGWSAPGALGPALGAGVGERDPGVNDATCRTMAVPLVLAITMAVALGAFVGLFLVKRRLTKEGWSLANALSEPTRLSIPVEERWTRTGGDRLSTGAEGVASRRVLPASDGTPMTVMLLEASSSRMIATLGGVGILMLYMGFGTFALYSFGLTCQLPDSITAVSTFLVSGMSLFAPYVVNKVSTAIQPRVRGAGPEDPRPQPVPPESGAPVPEAGGATGPSRVAHPAAAVAPGSPSVAAPAPAAPPATPEASAPVSAAPVGAPAAQTPADPSVAASPAAPAPSTPGPLSVATSPAAPAPSTPADPSVAASPAAPARPSRPVVGVSPPHRPLPQAAAQGSAAGAADAFSQAYAPGLDLIRSFEGFESEAYPDPASGAEPWTIGYGFTILAGQPVRPGQAISRAEADGELARQAQACAAHLAATIPGWGEMNSHQRCALLDFAWNLGADFYGDTTNFASLSRDLHDRAWGQVPQTLLLYCDPGTTVEAGLRRRREAEADLWRTPVVSASASTPVAAVTNPLAVPYCDQLQMADGQGWRECFTASSAMLAMHWGKEPDENVYDQLRCRYGDSTSSEAQLAALRSLGLQADFRTDGTAALLRGEIDAGRPVAVGWLCEGPVAAPSGGGHWSVIIGYDATGFFINDPYGNADLVNGGYLSHHDGAGLHYSSKNWLPRWRVGGSGGWMLTCRP